MNINGYVPFLINTLDKTVKVDENIDIYPTHEH